MRLLLILIIMALLLLILGFAITNLETRVPVTFWETTYQDVPLWSVVFVSVLLGVVSVGIIGVVDGGFVRLRNRQLMKENRRLESELNWLRTQPPTSRGEPDAVAGAEAAAGIDATQAPAGEDEERPRDDDFAPASAPVYQPDEVADEDPDDPYSGGRAV